MAENWMGWLPLSEIKPYENNPRKNDEAVKYVMESIKEFGFKSPMIIDKDHVIICGHTRYKAAKKLKLDEVPVVIAEDLTPEQVQAYRLADNKTGEKAEWDEDLLAKEMADILNLDMTLFGFEDVVGGALSDAEDDNPYTFKVNIPQYEITGAQPDLSELFDKDKADELIADINSAEGVTEEEKAFLREAAKRHTVFKYRNIAEYYAHATPEMQKLMEQSALVIIDVDDAIANGYATLRADILDMVEDD